MVKRCDETDSEETGSRHRYTPPRILETAAFETLAMACTKVPDEFECGQLGVPSES